MLQTVMISHDAHSWLGMKVWPGHFSKGRLAQLPAGSGRVMLHFFIVDTRFAPKQN